MDLILKKYEKYYPRYDREHNILVLQGKVPVEEFIKLRLLLKRTNIKNIDIRVEQSVNSLKI